jgi:hypothetical protein
VNESVDQNRARAKPPRVPVTRLHSFRLRVKRKMRNEAMPTTNGRECTRICETNPSPNRKDGMNGVAEAIFTKRTHTPIFVSLGVHSWFNRKLRNEPISVRIADFRISDLRLPGNGGHRPPLQENCETNPCARRPVQSFRFKVQSSDEKIRNEPILNEEFSHGWNTCSRM